ncbi:hypothetical protein NL676_036219 [Syzygium grande]|nr:hypothetical protein NL676_036219 [Syzygium grande]
MEDEEGALCKRGVRDDADEYGGGGDGGRVAAGNERRSATWTAQSPAATSFGRSPRRSRDWSRASVGNANLRTPKA